MMRSHLVKLSWIAGLVFSISRFVYQNHSSRHNFCLAIFRRLIDSIFLLTGLRIYTGEYKAQVPTLLRGPQALDSPV